MTDEQIIKALECCVNDDEGVLGFCNNGCPLFGKNANCPEVLRKNALDLINRQKVEIEEFKKVIDNMADKLVQKDAEIEKSVKTIDGLIVGQKTLFEREKTAKSKAIKEFAERVCEGRVANDPVVIAVNCELKEMVGEKDV